MESIPQNKKIFIIAGEHSGDLHAANLVKELLKKSPTLKISGVGGEKMKAAGVNLLYDLTDLAVVGFYQVIKNYPKIRKIFYELLARIKKNKPDLIILVDYPGFNLRFAKQAKNQGIKIAYYISPQIWAWKKNRIKLIKKYIDKMIVIFEFEKKLYEENDIQVDFAGHPLLDIVKPSLTEEKFKSLIEISSDEKIIGLLPGSRRVEIKQILPIMLRAAKKIKQSLNKVSFVLPYRLSTKRLMEKIITKENIQVRFIENNVYNTMQYSHLLLVASGTATLESACFLTPLIVIYKTSFLTWLLAKNLINVPFIGMVNLVSGKKIVPEYIQYQASPDNIAGETIKIIQDEAQIEQMKQSLQQEVKIKLGPGGASEKAAKSILAIL